MDEPPFPLSSHKLLNTALIKEAEMHRIEVFILLRAKCLSPKFSLFLRLESPNGSCLVEELVQNIFRMETQFPCSLDSLILRFVRVMIHELFSTLKFVLHGKSSASRMFCLIIP